MKTSPNTALLLSLLLFLSACVEQKRVPTLAEGALRTEDTLTLGLKKMENVEMLRLPSPSGYANNVVTARYKGKLYCMWQWSPKDEDSPDTKVLYSYSENGRTWTNPEILATPTDSSFASPGGWIHRGDSLAAIVNRIRADGRKGGSAWYTVLRADGTWTRQKPVLMEDGSLMEGIFEQDPMLLPDGRTIGAAHLGEALSVHPLYTDDPSGVSGWKKGAFPEGAGRPMEPSQYVTPSGELVMFFRDQKSSFRKLFSVSRDRGETWNAPELTNIPDSRSKQSAGNLPDGRCFWVGNPTGNKSRRILVLAISKDGYNYENAYLIAGPADLPPRKADGKYKTVGYNYPKATVLEEELLISLSVNKEDVVLYRIPLSSIR